MARTEGYESASVEFQNLGCLEMFVVFLSVGVRFGKMAFEVCEKENGVLEKKRRFAKAE